MPIKPNDQKLGNDQTKDLCSHFEHFIRKRDAWVAIILTALCWDWYGGFVADNLPTLSRPGGPHPSAGDSGRTAVLGVILPKRDRGRPVRHAQMIMGDKAVKDQLLDDCAVVFNIASAAAADVASEIASGRNATVNSLPIVRDPCTVRLGPLGTTTRLAPSSARSTRPRKKLAMPRKSATKRDTGRC